MSSGNNDNSNNIKKILLIVRIRIITTTAKQKIMTIMMMLVVKIKWTIKSKPSSKHDSAIYMASSITITKRSYFEEKLKGTTQYITEYYSTIFLQNNLH